MSLRVRPEVFGDVAHLDVVHAPSVLRTRPRSSLSTPPVPSHHAQPAPAAPGERRLATLEGVLERVTYANEENGYVGPRRHRQKAPAIC